MPDVIFLKSFSAIGAMFSGQRSSIRIHLYHSLIHTYKLIVISSFATKFSNFLMIFYNLSRVAKRNAYEIFSSKFNFVASEAS